MRKVHTTCPPDGCDICQSDWPCARLARQKDAESYEAALAAAKTQIGDLQLRIRELEASLIKAKDIPMKYKRMEFNAQLQDENSQLVDQLTAEREALVQERLVSDKLVAALRELSLYVAYNGDDWVKRQATAALAEVSNLRANIARIRKQT